MTHRSTKVINPSRSPIVLVSSYTEKVKLDKKDVAAQYAIVKWQMWRTRSKVTCFHEPSELPKMAMAMTNRFSSRSGRCHCSTLIGSRGTSHQVRVVREAPSLGVFARRRDELPQWRSWPELQVVYWPGCAILVPSVVFQPD